VRQSRNHHSFGPVQFREHFQFYLKHLVFSFKLSFLGLDGRFLRSKGPEIVFGLLPVLEKMQPEKVEGRIQDEARTDDDQQLRQIPNAGVVQIPKVAGNKAKHEIRKENGDVSFIVKG
jgi:hypothetical protein